MQEVPPIGRRDFSLTHVRLPSLAKRRSCGRGERTYRLVKSIECTIEAETDLDFAIGERRVALLDPSATVVWY